MTDDGLGEGMDSRWTEVFPEFYNKIIFWLLPNQRLIRDDCGLWKYADCSFQYRNKILFQNATSNRLPEIAVNLIVSAKVLTSFEDKAQPSKIKALKLFLMKDDTFSILGIWGKFCMTKEDADMDGQAVIFIPFSSLAIQKKSFWWLPEKSFVKKVWRYFSPSKYENHLQEKNVFKRVTTLFKNGLNEIENLKIIEFETLLHLWEESNREICELWINSLAKCQLTHKKEQKIQILSCNMLFQRIA